MGLQSLATGPMHAAFCKSFGIHTDRSVPHLYGMMPRRIVMPGEVLHKPGSPIEDYNPTLITKTCTEFVCMVAVYYRLAVLLDSYPCVTSQLSPPTLHPTSTCRRPKTTMTSRVCSDGSSRNRKGGSAVAILPPYGDVSQAVVCNNRIHGDCANIRAEVVARIRALKMILTLRRHLGPHIPIKYMTDSSFVLQVLSEAIKPTIYASEINELYDLWSKLCGSVVLRM